MVKFVNFIHRIPGMSQEAFLDHWKNVHAEIVRSVKDDIRMTHYKQTHPAFGSVGSAILDPRGMDNMGLEFDGLVETWWDSEEDFFAGTTSPEGKAAWAKIAADEPNFSDYTRAYIFTGQEFTIF